MRFIMFKRAIPRPLIQTWCLYETSHNLRQYGIYRIASLKLRLVSYKHRVWISGMGIVLKHNKTHSIALHASSVYTRIRRKHHRLYIYIYIDV